MAGDPLDKQALCAVARHDAWARDASREDDRAGIESQPCLLLIITVAMVAMRLEQRFDVSHKINRTIHRWGQRRIWGRSGLARYAEQAAESNAGKTNQPKRVWPRADSDGCVGHGQHLHYAWLRIASQFAGRKRLFRRGDLTLLHHGVQHFSYAPLCERAMLCARTAAVTIARSLGSADRATARIF